MSNLREIYSRAGNGYRAINNNPNPNQIEVGDLVEYTDEAKRILSPSADNKKRKVANMMSRWDNSIIAELDGEKFVNCGWLQKCKSKN